MKRTLAGILLLSALSSLARADIAIDFIGGSAPGNRGFLGGGSAPTMSPSEVAGVVPQRFWNTAGNTNVADRLGNQSGSITGTLTDDHGKILPTASISYKANNTSSTIIPDTPGNNRMMRGYLDSGDPSSPFKSSTTTLTVTVPADYAEKGYHLIVYFDTNSSAGKSDRVARYRLFYGTSNADAPAAQVFGKSPHNIDFNGQFIEATGASATEATVGNFVVFRGLKTSTFTLDATGVEGDVPRAAINGIQIVAAGTVIPKSTPFIAKASTPEPGGAVQDIKDYSPPPASPTLRTISSNSPEIRAALIRLKTTPPPTR